MGALLEDVKAYLAAQGVVTLEETYLYSAPDNPDHIVVIYDYAGASPRPQIASGHYSLQIVVRDMKTVVARDKAQAIYNSLTTEDGYLDITETRWSMIYLREPPFKIKTDNANRVYFGFNLGITTHTD